MISNVSGTFCSSLFFCSYCLGLDLLWSLSNVTHCIIFYKIPQIFFQQFWFIFEKSFPQNSTRKIVKNELWIFTLKIRRFWHVNQKWLFKVILGAKIQIYVIIQIIDSIDCKTSKNYGELRFDFKNEC